MTQGVKNTYIQTCNLTKKIGNSTIIDNLSFLVKEGEILGLLGPNGAGKSTTMKILVGNMNPTNGYVEIYGHDMYAGDQSAKNFIGYLPEHNPLYVDMYVSEYLHFNAMLKNIDAKIIPEKVDEIVNQCDLTKVYNKKICTLSKGYRQRVGLAQALIHDPLILILDEPTTGLDPSQIIEIRHLIKNISKHKAVILSTHIMQEVEMLCTDILILNSGKMLLNESTKSLQTKNSYKIIVEFKEEVPDKDLQLIKEVAKIEKQTNKKFLFYAQKSESTIQENIFTFAKDNNYTILEMKRIEFSIENIFSNLIKNSIKS